MNFLKYVSKFSLILSLSFYTSCKGPDARHPAEKAILESITALQDDDLSEFFHSTLTENEFDQLGKRWEEELLKDSELESALKGLKSLTAQGAEDTLMRDLKPVLQELKRELPNIIKTIEKSKEALLLESPQKTALSLEERQHISNTMDSIVYWAKKANLANEESARQAIGILCDTARSLNINKIDDIRALSLDEALAKGSTLLVAVKEMLAVYDLSLDQLLDSVEVALLQEDERKVRVTVSFDLLGNSQEIDVEMAQIGKRWFPVGIVEAGSLIPTLESALDKYPK